MFDAIRNWFKKLDSQEYHVGDLVILYYESLRSDPSKGFVPETRKLYGRVTKIIKGWHLENSDYVVMARYSEIADNEQIGSGNRGRRFRKANLFEKRDPSKFPPPLEELAIN